MGVLELELYTIIMLIIMGTGTSTVIVRGTELYTVLFDMGTNNSNIIL